MQRKKENQIMKQLIQRLSGVVLSVIAVPVLVAAPAYARQGGSDNGGSSSSGSGSTSSTTQAQPPVDPKKANETEVKNQVEAFKQKGQDTINSIEAQKDTSKKHTEQERQKSCETRSAELTKKLNKKVADAVKHKATFDNILTRVQNFHDTKNLTTTDYVALLKTAQDAQAAADTSITSLKSFDTSIDCTQVDAAATKVAAFREALKATRTSLKDYRTAIKNLI